MTGTQAYPMTHQGVRDLNNPVRHVERAGGDEKHGGSRVNVGPTERAASNLGGAVLAGLGLGRGGMLGLGLAALGGALIYRGSTGHCHAYAAVGMNTAKGGK